MKTTVKLVNELIIGDVIIERPSPRKVAKFKATGFPVPCGGPTTKTHVQVDHQRVWCYDSGYPVEVLVS